MEEINIYYDIKTLFNIPKKTFELYYMIESRIRKKDDRFNNILLVFPTKEIKERNMRNILARIQMYKIEDSYYEDMNGRCFGFCSITELRETKFLVGRSYNEIRFLG